MLVGNKKNRIHEGDSFILTQKFTSKRDRQLTTSRGDVVSSSSFFSEETEKTTKDFMLFLDQTSPKVQRYFFDENINLSLSSEHIGAKP